VELLAFVLIAGIVLWLVLARTAGKQLEQNEVNARDGLAHLLTAEMRGWEAGAIGGPIKDEVGPPQCIERGTRWVLERGRMAPQLAQMIAKEAYVAILSEKLERRIGLRAFAAWSSGEQKRERELERVTGRRQGVEKWWDDVDYRYGVLFEKAFESGALDREFSAEFYGVAKRRPEKPPRRELPAPATQRQVAPGPRSPTCSGCGAVNDTDATFCKRCGAKITRTSCPGCELTNDEDATFCKKCGIPLRAANATSSPIPEPATRESPAHVAETESSAPAPIMRLKACPSCGQENRGDAYQCSRCKHLFGASGAATSEPAYCRKCKRTSAAGATRCRWCLAEIKAGVREEDGLLAPIVRAVACPSCGQQNKGDAHRCSRCKHLFGPADAAYCDECGKASAAGATRCRWCLAEIHDERV
jgi:ribosomal protein L40E